MNIAKPVTKEQLIHYLITNISLGTYDKKFITNIYENNKPLTTNQNELLDKITLRYTKQLSKKNLRALDLINLPWTKPLIISSPEFTEAHIYIKEDMLYIRTPYKKDYIVKLKESNYPITWDRNKRVWYTEYCIDILKFIINTTEEHFSEINYCNEIKETIDYLCEFETCKYWDPTLVYINNRHYIVGCNEYVYNVVERFLEKLTPYNLTKLIRYGIKIDDSIIQVLDCDNASYINFSMQIHPALEADDIHNLCNHLRYINCNILLLQNTSYFSQFQKVEVERYFEDNGIELIYLNRGQHHPILEDKTLLDDKCIVLLTNQIYSHSLFDSYLNIDKVCHVLSSKPIPKTVTKPQYQINI